MATRLWPASYESSDALVRSEKNLLRFASETLDDGHFIVDINPGGLNKQKSKMGMYVSPSEGLITFTLCPGDVRSNFGNTYVQYVRTMERTIYQRLIESKRLVASINDVKFLKFPYKHILIFPNSREDISLSSADSSVLRSRIYSGKLEALLCKTDGSTEKVSLFDGVELPFYPFFSQLSDKECKAVFERLVPEYAVVLQEYERLGANQPSFLSSVGLSEVNDDNFDNIIYLVDDEQVRNINSNLKGHHLILANPGAGKSVVLINKALKLAGKSERPKVLLTCFNNNLANYYSFRCSCADVDNNYPNLHAMTFHKLVKSIYEEDLRQRCRDKFPSDEEIRKCIEIIKSGRRIRKYNAILIDEAQIFDPIYLQLCYLLLEQNEDYLFLLTGDLNQKIRSLTRKGDVPWKKIPEISLNFKGRVKYFKKNYRNSREIGIFLRNMLCKMNELSMNIGLESDPEYDINQFEIGNRPSLKLSVQTGIDRFDIKEKVIETIKHIHDVYDIGYSDICVLFPYESHRAFKYFIRKWVEDALNENDIPYSIIIQNDKISRKNRSSFSTSKGVILSTIDSSLGLDFKAVVVTGLHPYSYVFDEDDREGSEPHGYVKPKSINSYEKIRSMSMTERENIRYQMRKIYTACSRARDILYVLSDIKYDSPMNELFR